MIRSAEDGELESILAWLSHEAPLNLPIIGDLSRCGLGTDYLEVWVQLDNSGSRTALVRRHFEHFAVYAPPGADIEELGFFLRFSDPATVAGCRDTIDTLAEALDGYMPEVVRSMVLPGTGRLEPVADPTSLAASGLSIDRADTADADALGELIFATDAFRRNYHAAAEVAAGIRSRMRAGGVRHMVVRRNGRIVSHANTTAEMEGFALVSGVTTAPDAQRQGLASKLVSSLCRELLGEGRIPCLFAKSPGALAMYDKLGFVRTGEYVTLRRPE